MFACPALTKAGFVHAFSTRANGNLSDDHDAAENVSENRRRFLDEVGRSNWPLSTLKQTHSDKIIWVEASLAEKSEGDALLIDSAARFIGVKTADCVPILIGDPVTKSMAAVHAGWRGTLQRIVEKTVQELESQFHARAEDLIAAVGPAACGRCYEVGEDVATAFKKEFSDTRAFLVTAGASGKYFLNTPAANATQLIQSKVRAENVHVLPQCTMHQNDLFFSHRRESSAGGKVGRQLSIIGRL